MTLRAVLFDLDGVLVDSYALWFQLQNHAARELGYPAITEARYRAGWGQSTRDDRDTFFPNHDVRDVEAFYEAHYFEHLDHLVVAPGVPEVFARLDGLGIRSAVCTNTQALLASEVVRRAGALPEVIVGGDDVPRGKPAPDMIFRALELLGIPSEEAWMVGDSSYDRDAARAAGVRFVGLGIEGDVRIETLKDLLALL